MVAGFSMHGIIKQLVLVLKIDWLLIPWHLIQQHLKFLWFVSLFITVYRAHKWKKVIWKVMSNAGFNWTT